MEEDQLPANNINFKKKKKKKKKTRGKNFTDEEKKQFVEYVFGTEEENKYEDLEKIKGIECLRIPGYSTIYRWKNEIESKKNEKPKKKKKWKRGKQEILNDIQKRVLGGKIITLNSKKKVASKRILTLWVKRRFGKTLKKQTFFNYMKDLGFSSRKAKINGKKPSTKKEESNIQKMVKHIQDVRNYIEENNIEEENVIAVDVTGIKVFNNTLKTFAPIGCGQPPIEVSKDVKDRIHLFAGITLAGEMLPPVIISSSENIPYDVDEGKQAYVKFVKNKKAKGAGYYFGSIWLECVGEALAHECITLSDNGNEFKCKKIQEELEDRNIEIKYFPPWCGKYLNPCDNSFFSEFKAKLFTNIPETIGEWISHIINTYYDTEEDSIKNYFHKCGIGTNEEPSEVVRKLLNSNYKILEEKKDQVDDYVQHYKNYKKGLRNYS
eukprot:TRINITY_DN503_c0_g1_i1.p1 TRINITY_DN503_c0_g1~~TRINITY_DN503_c0_g1_i1.p1  ORF type:complete len:436 (+),score=127.11 TRINITY_DN503_c0_g1_i1:73-1380(+)